MRAGLSYSGLGVMRKRGRSNGLRCGLSYSGLRVSGVNLEGIEK